MIRSLFPNHIPDLSPTDSEVGGKTKEIFSGGDSSSKSDGKELVHICGSILCEASKIFKILDISIDFISYTAGMEYLCKSVVHIQEVRIWQLNMLIPRTGAKL